MSINVFAETEGMLRIVLVSARPLFRGLFAEALRNKIPANVLAELSADELLRETERIANANLFIVDATRSGSALAAIDVAKKICPHARVLVVTECVGDYLLSKALKAGATGMIALTDSLDEMLAAAVTVGRGGVYYGPTVVERKAQCAIGPLLTPRELTVLELACRATPDEESGKALGISSATVESHRSSIQRKLGVADWAELLILGIRLAGC